MVFNPSILAARQVVWPRGSPLRISNSLLACSQYLLDAVEVYVFGSPRDSFRLELLICVSHWAPLETLASLL